MYVENKKSKDHNDKHLMVYYYNTFSKVFFLYISIYMQCLYSVVFSLMSRFVLFLFLFLNGRYGIKWYCKIKER